MCCRCWEMTGNNDTLDNNVSWKNNWIKEFLLLWNFCLLFDQLGFFQFGPLYATCVLLREMGQKPFGLFFSFSTLFFFPDQTKWTSKLAIFRGKPILNSILETSYAWTEDKGATLTRTLANTQCSASEPKTSPPLKMSNSNDARSRVKTFFSSPLGCPLFNESWKMVLNQKSFKVLFCLE